MMNFEDWNQLQMLLEKDIRNVMAKGDISPQDYGCLDKAIDIYKDISTIAAMDEYGNGTSGAMMPYENSWGQSGNNSYAQGGQGGNSGMGNSYARGRSATTGRYVSRDDEMHQKLNNMMNTAGSEQERVIIQRMMNELGV